jgi:hypothetical protein
MPWGKSGTSCGNCGGKDGKHVGGCNAGGRRQQRQEAGYNAAQQRVEDSVKKKAEDYVRKYGRVGWGTKYQPGSHGIPHGTHMEKQSDGLYHVVLD